MHIRPVNCKPNGHESESYETTYCYAGPFLNIFNKKMKRPNKHIKHKKKHRRHDYYAYFGWFEKGAYSMQT